MATATTVTDKALQSIGVLEQVEKTQAIGHLNNQEEHEETVRQALTRHPKTLFWCLYAIWCLMLSSFDNQAGGVVLGIPEFRKDFGSPFAGDYVLPAKWQSAYNGGPTASTVIGALGAGYVADKIGRKLTYLIAFVIVLVGITLETVSTTNEVFFAGKFINGFSVGAFITISMTYVGEISPLALRGILTAACALAFTVGPFIVALIVNGTGAQTGRWAYRTIFVSQYGVTAVGLIGLPFMPESPWWLLNANKDDKAVRSLRRLGNDDAQTQKKMAHIRLTLEKIRHETAGVTYFECFRGSNLRRTIISIAPLSIQALCGVFFIAAYATYYFQLAGYSASASFRIGVIQQVLSMLGNVVSWFIIDKVGRRNISFYGLGFLTVLLLVTGGLAVAGSAAAIKGTVGLIMIYCFAYNVTIGATAYTLLTEVATSRLRAKTASMGLALQQSLFTMWAFVIPYLFNPDQANLGAKVSFIFGALSVFCTFYFWWYQPETSGRSYEELDEMFMKHVPARKFKTYQTEAKAEGEEVHRRLSHVSIEV